MLYLKKLIIESTYTKMTVMIKTKWLITIHVATANIIPDVSNVPCRLCNVPCRLKNVPYELSNVPCRLSNVPCRFGNVP